MNSNRAMKNHLNNISRQVGSDVSNRYNFVVSNDELINAYLQMRNELGYPLMIDSKNRRAIVYNKIGLEKKIQQLINDGIVDNIKRLESTIANDIVDSVYKQLNGVIQNGNGKVISNSKTNIFTDAMTKGVVNGIGRIFDDMMDINEDIKR